MSRAIPILITLFLLSSSCLADQIGLASWYGDESGSHTANGEKFIPKLITAAHRNLPFNTLVAVTRLSSGRTVVVRINDRGPAKRTGRLIDLSRGAAAQLGMLHQGVVKVKIRIVR